jgi:hypothetical protein
MENSSSLLEQLFVINPQKYPSVVKGFEYLNTRRAIEIPESTSTQELVKLRSELTTLFNGTQRNYNHLNEQIERFDSWFSDKISGSMEDLAPTIDNLLSRREEILKAHALQTEEMYVNLVNINCRDQNKRKNSEDTSGTIRIKLVAPKIKEDAPLSADLQSPRSEKSTEPKFKKQKNDNSNSRSSKNINLDEGGKPKIPNQVPITAFWSYVDGFFRKITDDDIRFLQNKEIPPEYFLIPPVENKNFKKKISFKDRLFSSFLEEKLYDPEVLSQDEKEEDASGQDQEVPIPDLEQRILAELQLAGLVTDLGSEDDDDEHTKQDREDDEICVEIRKLQAKLKEQATINGYRKTVLLERVVKQAIYQDFASVMDDIDKQFEFAFSKRVKNMKRKKKQPSSASSSSKAQNQTVQLVQILEKRKNLLKRFKGIVPTQSELEIPTESIYKQSEIDAELSNYPLGLLSLPSLPLAKPLPIKPPVFILKKESE